ncbi:MAG: GntR family transcriptional regulator [Actinomycetota bacterium]
MPRLNVTSGSRAVSIDRNSPVPLYFQLAQHLEKAIRSGALPVGTRLDNEVQLAKELGLSRPTVRAAFLYLADRGMVTRKRGYGTVVAREKINRDVQLTSLFDDLTRAGQKPTTKVLRNEVGVASEAVAAALELPEESLVICLERIRFADEEPIALMHNFLPAALVHLNNEMLETHGLYEILGASGIALSSATQRMSAKNASAAQARMLDEPRGAALLTMERTVRDARGAPVEFGQHVYRASRYALGTTLRMD